MAAASSTKKGMAKEMAQYEGLWTTLYDWNTNTSDNDDRNASGDDNIKRSASKLKCELRLPIVLLRIIMEYARVSQMYVLQLNWFNDPTQWLLWSRRVTAHIHPSLTTTSLSSTTSERSSLLIRTTPTVPVIRTNIKSINDIQDIEGKEKLRQNGQPRMKGSFKPMISPHNRTHTDIDDQQWISRIIIDEKSKISVDASATPLPCWKSPPLAGTTKPLTFRSDRCSRKESLSSKKGVASNHIWPIIVGNMMYIIQGGEMGTGYFHQYHLITHSITSIECRRFRGCTQGTLSFLRHNNTKYNANHNNHAIPPPSHTTGNRSGVNDSNITGGLYFLSWRRQRIDGAQLHCLDLSQSNPKWILIKLSTSSSQSLVSPPSSSSKTSVSSVMQSVTTMETKTTSTPRAREEGGASSTTTATLNTVASRTMEVPLSLMRRSSWNTGHMRSWPFSTRFDQQLCSCVWNNKLFIFNRTNVITFDPLGTTPITYYIPSLPTTPTSSTSMRCLSWTKQTTTIPSGIWTDLTNQLNDNSRVIDHLNNHGHHDNASRGIADGFPNTALYFRKGYQALSSEWFGILLIGGYSDDFIRFDPITRTLQKLDWSSPRAPSRLPVCDNTGIRYFDEQHPLPLSRRHQGVDSSWWPRGDDMKAHIDPLTDILYVYIAIWNNIRKGLSTVECYQMDLRHSPGHWLSVPSPIQHTYSTTFINDCIPVQQFN
jgi:hypothetical protein